MKYEIYILTFNFAELELSVPCCVVRRQPLGQSTYKVKVELAAYIIYWSAHTGGGGWWQSVVPCTTDNPSEQPQSQWKHILKMLSD